jgi:hypothetical protein
MHQCCCDTAKQVEKKISRPAQTIFNIITENPEGPYITEQMHPSAVRQK